MTMQKNVPGSTHTARCKVSIRIVPKLNAASNDYRRSDALVLFPYSNVPADIALVDYPRLPPRSNAFSRPLRGAIGSPQVAAP